jgi:thiamine-phosphate pyrophosphorylase
MLPKLQYISQGITPDMHLVHIESALDAGVSLIQFRLKNSSDELYLDLAHRTKALCDAYGAKLIINDHARIARGCNSDALHLGLTDMPVPEAKKLLPGKLVGGTANTFEHVQQRCAEQVDYIGLGPYRFTSTKEKLSPVLGLEGYKSIIKQMKAENLHTPVYAIGGIELKDIASIVNTGVYGIAVSSLITQSHQKETLVKEINHLLYHA